MATLLLYLFIPLALQFHAYQTRLIVSAIYEIEYNAKNIMFKVKNQCIFRYTRKGICLRYEVLMKIPVPIPHSPH